MEVRVIRSSSKNDEQESVVRAAITWATLIQEQTKAAWEMSDEQIVEMVKVKAAEILDYESTHDEFDNPVDAIEVRVGKVGYSVSTVFDDFLSDIYEGEICLPS